MNEYEPNPVDEQTLMAVCFVQEGCGAKAHRIEDCQTMPIRILPDDGNGAVLFVQVTGVMASDPQVQATTVFLSSVTGAASVIAQLRGAAERVGATVKLDQLVDQYLMSYRENGG